MKSIRFLFALLVLAASAYAEMQFPPYESLSPKDKEAWGYKIDKFVSPNEPYAILDLIIPPKAAKYYQGARLYFRDKDDRLSALVHPGLEQAKDGSLHFRVELFQGLGRAELVIYTREIPEAPFLRDMGGFTFSVQTKPKHP